ncbi:MAG: hypothetical protein PHO94_11535 [Petrimonas sp.]|nr:hypothetical protein [Petrimonas sp.]
MGIIKEPISVDFEVESRPLTKDEETAISDFIRADKERRKKKTMRLQEKRKRKANDLV